MKLAQVNLILTRLQISHIFSQKVSTFTILMPHKRMLKFMMNMNKLMKKSLM